MPHDIQFYLDRGFDRAAAEYFAAGRRKIVAVTPNPDFTLTLQIDNGEVRVYDAKPLFEPGTVFERFGVWENFSRVYLDDVGDVAWDIDPNVNSNEVWNNKVDLCRDQVYLESVPVGGVPDV